jgi:hypothetical protein
MDLVVGARLMLVLNNIRVAKELKTRAVVVTVTATFADQPLLAAAAVL